jgi:signal transduction histidine kinase
VGRLERILKDTLSFSREAKYHLVHTNIGDLLPEIGEAFADLCREKGVTLVVEPTYGLPSCIVDRDQIRQTVHNLLANAIDAMPAGGTLTLRTRTEKDNGVNYVVTDVIDTGVGIPEEKVNRIFDPFFSTKEIGHGTGLGLSICKKIMEEHRGSIRVSAAPGGGATFSLYIPYIPVEEIFEAQCWEIMRCGVDSTGNAAEKCPAFPNYGRICWSVAGTSSETRVHCPMSLKIGDCHKCAFYGIVNPSRPS